MGRVLAIDYGQKRVGLAVTDEYRIIANQLDTVHVSEIIKYLKAYVAREKVDIFLVGEPRQMDYTLSDASRFIEPFVKLLKKEFPGFPIERVDERFTSKLAARTILEAGLKKKDRQDKALVDRVSATIILQSWLEAQSYKI
jgi:putative Holliday junction resolvase